MADLFQSPSELVPIDLPGADVSYQERIDLGSSPDTLLQALITETPWKQEMVTVWGKSFLQPRLVAWYGDAGRSYSYSGVRLQPLLWTLRLRSLKDRIEAATASSFNSVLLNYYRDNNDSMGMHSDDEKELGPTPVIASVSLGAERVISFKSRTNPALKTRKITLSSGSLLLMKGDTQRNYKHGIAKDSKPRTARINLTFRTIFD